MSFLTSLDVRVLDDCGPRPRLMTLAPLMFESQVVGTVEVPAGFEFDGSSVPSGVIGAIAGMNGISATTGIRAACLHDYLVDRIDRLLADRTFKEALQVCNVEQNVVDMMYAAVRVYSRSLEPPQFDDNVGA